jgi:hypothetical protein
MLLVAYLKVEVQTTSNKQPATFNTKTMLNLLMNFRYICITQE